MKTRIGIPVVLLSLLLVAGSADASVSNDQVQSQHIREADGTSGQNTNSGAGVKTGHIQDSAVTSVKIQDGQVMNADLASGAVTDAKISGVISASKLEKPERVVTVSPSGGDFSSIRDALDAINPTVDQPYLIQVMPGTYPSLEVYKNYVHIKGSGRSVTKIQLEPGPANGVVVYASIVEISGLTIEGRGPEDLSSVCGLWITGSVNIHDNAISSIPYGICHSGGMGKATIQRNTIENVRVGIQEGNASSFLTDNMFTCDYEGALPSYGYQSMNFANSTILRNVFTGCTWDIFTGSTDPSNISFNVYDTRNQGGGSASFNVRSDGSPW